MEGGLYILTGLLAGAIVVGGVAWYVSRTSATAPVQPVAWNPPAREDSGDGRGSGSRWTQDFGTFASGVGELAGAVDRFV